MCAISVLFYLYLDNSCIYLSLSVILSRIVGNGYWLFEQRKLI